MKQGTQWVHVSEPRGGYQVQRFRNRIERFFERFEKWTNLTSGRVHWLAYARDGTVSVFGLAADNSTRIADPTNPDQRTFQWLLEGQYDAKGNAITYEYKAEDGAGVDHLLSFETRRLNAGGPFPQRYLRRVRYGNSKPLSHHHPIVAGNEWRFEVVLDYGEHDRLGIPNPDDAPPVHAWAVRADPFSTHHPGFELRTYRLCRRILMFHRFPELGAAPCLVGTERTEGICRSIISSGAQFVPRSADLAQRLYDASSKPDGTDSRVSDGTLVVARCAATDGTQTNVPFVALLKLDSYRLRSLTWKGDSGGWFDPTDGPARDQTLVRRDSDRPPEGFPTDSFRRPSSPRRSTDKFRPRLPDSTPWTGVARLIRSGPSELVAPTRTSTPCRTRRRIRGADRDRLRSHRHIQPELTVRHRLRARQAPPEQQGRRFAESIPRRSSTRCRGESMPSSAPATHVPGAPGLPAMPQGGEP